MDLGALALLPHAVVSVPPFDGVEPMDGPQMVGHRCILYLGG
jgi:hypothetical protein